MQALSDPDLMQKRMEYIALCPAQIEFTEYEYCRGLMNAKFSTGMPCVHELCVCEREAPHECGHHDGRC